jgi:hypothetical protein
VTALLEPEVQPLTEAEKEALIKEARRLRRRRWGLGSALIALAVSACVGGYFIVFGPPSAPHHTAPPSGSNAPSSSGTGRKSVPTRSPDLIQPTTLASLPGGDVLIMDSSRDQILRLTPNGQLSVFAGTGRLGFSGDGRPARDADLDLSYFSSAGMSVTRTGAVDFLDDGTCRIRQITPSGLIRTVLSVPSVKTYGHHTTCPVSAFALSPNGHIYLATSSVIERVSRSGRLVWVAGSRENDAEQPAGPARLNVPLDPDSLAFDHQGDLFISSFAGKLIYELTPRGRLNKVGISYAHQLTQTDSGAMLAGTQEGVIDTITPGAVKPFFTVVPKQAGIHWPDQAFQEDGIAVTKNGTIYVDNAQGNGWGAATVMVRIDANKHASLAHIRTPLTATLPKVGAPGFPVGEYPAARSSDAHALNSCPSNSGLEPLSASAITKARRIARTYLSRQFASDIAVTDRSWWTGAFNADTHRGVFGTQAITNEASMSQTPIAATLARACGSQLVNDSIVITVSNSVGSDSPSALYLLDRNGHALVYDDRPKTGTVKR